MKIHVVKEDIELGQQNAPCLCPVARAVQRRLGLKDKDVQIHGKFGAIFIHEILHKVSLPQEAADWIDQFDSFGREHVAPFEFELAL